MWDSVETEPTTTWLREPRRRPRATNDRTGAFRKGNVNVLDLARRTMCQADLPKDWDTRYDYGVTTVRGSLRKRAAQPKRDARASSRATRAGITDLSRDELLALWSKAIARVGGQAAWDRLSPTQRETALRVVA